MTAKTPDASEAFVACGLVECDGQDGQDVHFPLYLLPWKQGFSLRQNKCTSQLDYLGRFECANRKQCVLFNQSI